ncbi:MAG: hypothetical protein GTO63_07780 [Anaerolineae bacterium]|nr:hypothetical protein [Anaerolineae bacterium]NIN94804.1 hypothetical protein [Anaerolineae bacterium]NIQ77886.1 hypothetical protein [Anaerolineae bacterium]
MGSKQYFEEVASQWEEMRAAFFSDAVREKAISLARVEPGKVALQEIHEEVKRRLAGRFEGSISSCRRWENSGTSELMPSRHPSTSPPSLTSPGCRC